MNLHIRPATENDGAPVATLYAPFVRDSFVSFEAEAPDGAEMANRIRATTARLPWLVATVDDRLAGYAYASPHRQRAAYRWAVETSVFVDPAFHRRGVGRMLVGTLLTELESLGYVTAWAGVALPNDGSVALHESMGFQEVGVYEAVGFKNGAWRDVVWYRATLCEPRGEPHEPLEWHGST